LIAINCPVLRRKGMLFMNEDISTEEEVLWLARDIEYLLLKAKTEEQTQQICNALCKMIAIIRERKNCNIDIANIGKEIQEVLMHDK